jgi:phosphodiesterase/alkaline phosphatase D-like protein
MKLSLAFLFISVFAFCFAAAQNPSPQEQQINNGPVAEYVSDSNCTIGWSTRVPGAMTLRYGTDPSNKMMQTKEAVESNDGRNHHVRIDGLTPNTRYYLRVLKASGEAVSGIGTFQTVAAGDAPVRSKAIIPQ